MNDNNTSYTSLSISISIAIAVHCLLALSAYLLNLDFIIDDNRTVPIILVSPNSTPNSPNKMSNAENAQAAQEFLHTLNTSNTKVQASNEPKAKPNAPSAPNPKTAPLLPSQNAKTNNSSKAITDLQNMFSKQASSKSVSAKKQVSTKETEELSQYELQLLNALAKEQLYDAFHSIMASKNKQEVGYKITLSLFPNGAIKSATMSKSSGETEIDQLAIQTAYRASPFPAPPKEDITIRYRYTIPIIYKRK